MKTVTPTTGLALAALLTAAASCDRGPDGTEVADRLASSICDLAFDCCSAEETNLVLGHYVTEAACAERLVASASLAPTSSFRLDVLGAEASLPNLAALDRAIADGRIGVIEEELDSCLAYLDGLPCNEETDDGDDEDEACTPPEPPEEPACDAEAIFEGRVGEGGTCTSTADGLECAPGLTCLIDPDLGVEGACVPLADEGEACFLDRECRDGLYCSQLEGVCRTPSGEGESCLRAEREGEPPGETLIPCETGLACDSVTDTCVIPCERGAPCFSDADCSEEAGYACVMGRCDFLRAADLPCEVDGDCEDGLRCVEDAPGFEDTPVCADPLDDGEPCDPLSENEECASGYCDPFDAVCAQPASPGELCPTGDDAECAGGFCETSLECETDDNCVGGGSCDQVTGFCDPYCVGQQPDGASCEADVECASGSCVVDTCRELPLSDGTPCSADAQCESSFCSLDEEPVCERLPLPSGAPCATDGQCESEICFQGECDPGLSQGEPCAELGDPPCARDLYCNQAETEPTCHPLHRPGQPCERDAECAGACELRFGQFVCDEEAPPGVLMCEAGT